MSTTTDLSTLKINYLTQAQYDEALEAGTINADEIYMTPVIDESYSTTEQITNKTWINGKPIYRRVFTFNNTALANNAIFSVPISELDEVVYVYGYLNNDGSILPFPTTTSDGKVLGFRYVKSTERIAFYGNDSWGAAATRTIYFVFEYTKS